MHKLIRFWNQNRNPIIKFLAIIIFIFIVLQVINGFAKSKNQKKLNEISNLTNTTTVKSATDTDESKGLVSNKSAVTGQSLSKGQLQSATDIIYNFVNYCNQQELDKAYDLLTDECKQEIYTTLEVFKNAYYQNIFNGQKRNCTIENWVGDTYRVKIAEDMLATGKDTGYSKEDYITIKEVNGESKLNINNYIGYKSIDKTTSKENISINVVSKNIYKEYEEYTIKVTNNTDGNIQLDTTTSTNTLYLEDSKGMKYYYYNHELTDPSLTIVTGQTKEVKIKFYSNYVSTKDIRYIVFSNLILKNGQITEKIDFRANV